MFIVFDDRDLAVDVKAKHVVEGDGNSSGSAKPPVSMTRGMTMLNPANIEH